MTDAGEKLRERATQWMVKRYGPLWKVGVSKMMPLGDIPNELTEFLRAELERAAQVADDCQCDRSAKCSCAEHAADIRLMKE